MAGVIAHAPPFQDEQFAANWRQLCADYDTPPPSFEFEHTGWGFMVRQEALRLTPAYFNFGMVAAPAEMMEIVSSEMEKADDFVNARLDTFFRFQIALTLTLQKHDLPVRALPLRYNFPNDPRFDSKDPEKLSNVRILHYLRCEIIHREKDFWFKQSRGPNRSAGPMGSNEIFRRRLAQLYPSIQKEEAFKESQRTANHAEQTAIHHGAPSTSTQCGGRADGWRGREQENPYSTRWPDGWAARTWLVLTCWT